ncbi:MAG: alpha/beta hydrolase [Anaerolineae bacterium]|nr:alpha/beta hydrolase [Anaerolineae bacterium]
MNRIPVHIKPFQGDEHQPFYWNGGQPAALLVHGFPGTPADPQVRHGISNFLPDVDLDDPDVQAEIRDFSIPTRIFEQLARVGNEAYRVAPHINTPTLIVQGTQDNTVPAHRTRRLLQQLPGPVHYKETNTGHDLTRADDPGWPDVRRAVVSFSQTVLIG